MQHFSAAPWPVSLKVTSAAGSLLLLAVAYGALKAVPPTGFAHAFGSVVACVPPAIALVGALFVVRGYEIDRTRLCIHRLLWSTVIRLDGLKRACEDPEAIRCSGRVFGNGGLFSFTGLYQNKKLGRYRLFATDPARAVVLLLPQRIIVVTPAAPQAFVGHVRRLFPSAHE